MNVKPDPRYLETLSREVDRLARAISIPGSSVTNAELKAAQDKYDDALLATLQDEPKRFDQVAFIMAYEAGELEHDDVVEGFQHLIDSGTVWHLQGSYGRAAQRLIDAGLCHR
jgi:hypothetical protein